MTRVVYVNGRYQGHFDARVHVEDRGYLFADGVYDAFELRQGRIIDMDRHLDRLFRSLGEISIANVPERAVFEHIMRETVRRNRYVNGFIYLQVTRGVAPRNFNFPSPETPAAIICIVYNAVRGAVDKLAKKGVRVITSADIRWKRPDIKSLLLLPAVLAKQAATEQGAFESWMYDEQGFVTEGSASNAWIITKDHELVSRPRDRSILGGITRQAVLELVEQTKLRFVERAFTVEEALEAKEAFITACSITVMPVVRIDDVSIGTGKPGELTLRLREFYQKRT